MHKKLVIYPNRFDNPVTLDWYKNTQFLGKLKTRNFIHHKSFRFVSSNSACVSILFSINPCNRSISVAASFWGMGELGT